MSHKIWLGPADGSNVKALLVEGLAQDAIVPGSLVVRVAAGLATSTKAATVFDSEPLLAQEVGAHLGATITDPYEVGDNSRAVKLRSGEFALARVAASQDITSTGVALSSNGDGTLKIAATDDNEQILFYSEEIVNTGGSVALVAVSKA